MEREKIWLFFFQLLVCPLYNFPLFYLESCAPTENHAGQANLTVCWPFRSLLVFWKDVTSSTNVTLCARGQALWHHCSQGKTRLEYNVLLTAGEWVAPPPASSQMVQNSTSCSRQLGSKFIQICMSYMSSLNERFALVKKVAPCLVICL